MKRTVFALIALLAVLLTACSQGDDQKTVTGIVDGGGTTTTEKTEENFENAVTNDGETASKEKRDFLSTVSVQMVSNRFETADDDGTVLCYANLTTPQVSIRDNEEAARTVNDILQAQADSRSEQAEQLAEQARSDREARGEDAAFSGYSANDAVSVGRLDETVIDLLWTASDNLGGAHGGTMTTAWVFDAETGARLHLSDVTGDYEGLAGLLTERVTAEIEAAPEQYFSQAQELVPQLLEDGCWYFSEEGIVLLATPELLAPFAAGTLEFTVPYSDLEGLLDAKWMPEAAQTSTGEPQIALQSDDGAPAATVSVQTDEIGAEMVLWTDDTLEDFRIWRVASSDGITWYRGNCCYAADRLGAGEAVGLTAMLPDVMTNTMISYTGADGETVYRGIGESGKDGSVFFLDLDTVTD